MEKLIYDICEKFRKPTMADKIMCLVDFFPKPVVIINTGCGNAPLQPIIHFCPFGIQDDRQRKPISL